MFADVFAALLAAHYIGDHWVQRHWSASMKGRRGWIGRAACAEHVATYTATALSALLTESLCLGMHLDWWRVAAGLTVSAVTHYFADRRGPFERFARAIGRGSYLDYGTVVRQPGGDAHPSGPGTALFHLDQSWHIAWLFVAALIIT